MDSAEPKSTSFRNKGRKRRPLNGGSELGDLLETLRTEQGWTLNTAAEESGISKRIIAKLEKGRLDTSAAHLEAYLNLYRFTLSAKSADANKFEKGPQSVALDDKGLPKW